MKFLVKISLNLAGLRMMETLRSCPSHLQLWSSRFMSEASPWLPLRRKASRHYLTIRVEYYQPRFPLSFSKRLLSRTRRSWSAIASSIIWSLWKRAKLQVQWN